MKQQLDKIFSIGEGYYLNEADKRRACLLNLGIFGTMLVVLLVLLPVTIFQESKEETTAAIVFIITLLIAFVLNLKGYNQLGVVGMMAITMISQGYAIWRAPTQIGAPYVYLVLGLSSIILVKKKWLKTLCLILSVALFFLTNYYQLKYKPFSGPEYVPVLFALIILFVVIRYYDHLMVSYQDRISKQSKELLRLEEEKYQKELKLQQKDLEKVVASASARDQLTENLTAELRKISKSSNIQRDLTRVIHALNAQSDFVSKQNLIRHNIEEINARFYDRLLEEFSGLTKSERELCAYLKLSLSNKEIASIKNTTENSVNVSKARLRKKMNIETNKELQDFLFMF